MAQSTLSHQIAPLERKSGTRLFQRSRRGIELTEAKQRFAPHAVSILRQTEEAAASAHQTTEELTGNLSQQLMTDQLHPAAPFDDSNLSEFKHTSMLSECMYLIEPAQPGKNAPRRITLKRALSGMPKGNGWADAWWRPRGGHALQRHEPWLRARY